MEKMNTKAIKHNNRRLIYNYIRENNSASKQDIVYGLKLSLPTVTKNLEYLEENELIETSKKIENTGGRNATAYTFLEKAKMAIGFDITARKIKAVLVNLRGEVIAIEQRYVQFEMSDTYYANIKEMVDVIIDKNQVMEEQLLGVGIAVPGLISDAQDVVVNGLILDFTGMTIEEIAKDIPYPCRLLQDANASGCAESWENSEVHNSFYIMLSNAVCGYIQIANNIYNGEAGKSGEIGHTSVVQEGGRECYCGKRGCLEAYCSAEQLSKYANEDIEEFFRRYDAGDETLKEVLDEYLYFLSIAIVNVRMLFDCKIIVGGYVGAYMNSYKDKLYELVNARDPFRENAEEFLVPCKRKVEVIASGAAISYIEEWLQNI